MNASDIVNLLKARHVEDTVVPECKIGQTSNGCLRFDVWVMKNSWAHEECIGYEIKVNRSDFLNDTKYRGYLNYCNTFYFVCPSGLIDKDELEDGIGLLWVSKTGNILYRKKKAKFRDIIIPQDIFKYILMARAEIKNSNFYSRHKQSKKAFFEEWLKTKEINRNLGFKVSATLSKKIEEKIINVEDENNRLKRENERLEEVKDILKSLSIESYNAWNIKHRIEEKLEEIKTGFSKELLNNINQLYNNLTFLKNSIENND